MGSTAVVSCIAAEALVAESGVAENDHRSMDESRRTEKTSALLNRADCAQEFGSNHATEMDNAIRDRMQQCT